MLEGTPGGYDGRCEQTSGEGPFDYNSTHTDCFNYTLCECYWDANEGKCKGASAKWMECFGKPPFKLDYCIYNLTKWEDHCDQPSGWIYGEWNATWMMWDTNTNQYIEGSTADAIANGCEPIQNNIPCSAVTRIPFFSTFNLIISITLLTIFYLIKIFKKS